MEGRREPTRRRLVGIAPGRGREARRQREKQFDILWHARRRCRRARPVGGAWRVYLVTGEGAIVHSRPRWKGLYVPECGSAGRLGALDHACYAAFAGQSDACRPNPRVPRQCSVCRATPRVPRKAAHARCWATTGLRSVAGGERPLGEGGAGWNAGPSNCGLYGT
jgi:hypothetical protein